MEIEVGSDGQPVDKALRSFVVRLRTNLSDNPRKSVHSGKADELLRSMLSKDRSLAAVDADDMLAALLSSGILIRRGSYYMFASTVRRGGPAERVRRFEEYVQAVAGRSGLSEPARGRLETLIRMLSNVDGAHEVDVGSGKGVLVPRAIQLGAECIEITGAWLVVFDPEKRPSPVLFAVKEAGIAVEWRDRRHLVGRVELDPKAKPTFLTDMKLFSNVSINRVGPLHDAGRAVTDLLERREEIEAFIGEPLVNRKWNALRKSLKPKGSAKRLVSLRLTKMLDPEARRVALRNPYATYETYAQIVRGSSTDFERRRQFSESFPVFTALLPMIDEAVVAGAPIFPVLSGLTGLSHAHLKRFRGVHWQRIGRHVRMLLEDVGQHGFYEVTRGDKACGCYEILKDVAVDRMPQNRREWEGLQAVNNWRGNVKGRQWTNMLAAVSRNWAGYADLNESDFWHSLDDTANALESVYSGKITWYKTKASNRVREMVIDEVCGERFGLKRMKTFSAIWHKGEARRTALRASIRRAVFNQEPASWRPLTPDRFQHPSGSMSWLLNEDELAVEGQVMKHCVGSYWEYCASGKSHIAQVHGTDGGRSTVELRIASDGSLELAQHHAFRDGTPTKSCVSVVAAFLKEHRTSRFAIVEGSGRKGFPSQTDARRIPGESVAQLVEAFSDCVSRDFLGTLADEGARLRGSENRF